MEELLETPADETAPGAEAVDDEFEADETEHFAAPAEDAFKGKHIFISHKCDVEPDDTVAAMLHSELSALGCVVYLDQDQPIGARYDDAIGDSIKKADFVVVLLSKDANESDWVKFELDYAYAQFQQLGRPAILPVGLGISVADLSMRLGARVGGFTARSYEPSDHDEILADVKEGISHEPRAHKRTGVGMEGFLVRKFRRNITRVVYLDSPQMRRAGEALRREKLFWVVGDASIRNHVARSLAVKERDRQLEGGLATEQGPNIYEVPRTLHWSKIADQLVRDSIIIFLDAHPSSLFDAESQRDQLKSLQRLTERNLVIVTAAAESLSEIEQEMRDRELAGGAHLPVGHDFYDERARLEIFERLLDFSHDARDISPEQYQWAHQLLEQSEGREILKASINKWSPADIERFMTRHLPEVKRPDDVFKLLQRNADLDNEIHTWFIALDDSTRCFVLVLAMLCGLRREQFWKNYKLIFGQLKKLDANLSLWPLGIGRHRAALYVTTEGQVDFVDERIAEAIYREVSKNFREYLIDLEPLIKTMSVPAGRDQTTTEKRKLEVAETKEVRTALARVVGKAGRQGLEDLTDLLNFWGADSALPVREAVALCMEQAVAEQVGARQALALLEGWSRDASNGREALCKRWSAASALGSIVATRPGRVVCERALELLEQLAGDDHPSTKFNVSISLKKTARKIPLVANDTSRGLATSLALVARDAKAATKINVAEALIEARIADEAAALAVIREWVSGEDIDCRWAAMCSLFLWRRQDNRERNREVAGFLTLDTATAADVLVETLTFKHQKMRVLWQCFKQFVLEADDATRKLLVAGLASVPQARFDDQLLSLLRACENRLLSGLVIEVRAERWRRMFSTPTEFLTDLRKEIKQESLAGEVGASLARLAKPEPEGCRSELVQALVSSFPQHRVRLDDILKRLTIIAPPVFEPFSLEVRCEGLRKLFADPLTFVAVVAEGLGNAEVSGEICVALETLAQPEPQGDREELLQTLAAAQVINAAAVRTLLQQFRAASSNTLSLLAYEINLHSLEGDLANPERFLSRVMEATRDRQQRVEVFQLLRQLSLPEPQGRHKALVRALGVSRVSRPGDVNALLDDSSWQTNSGLLSLRTEVKLLSFLARIFSPGFVSRMFVPEP